MRQSRRKTLDSIVSGAMRLRDRGACSWPRDGRGSAHLLDLHYNAKSRDY